MATEEASSVNTTDEAPEFPMSRTLRIDKLTRNVNEDHLHGIFSTYGKLDSVTVKIDPKVKLSLGYGFVEFKEVKDAEKAFKHMNSAQIDGKQISIKFKELSIGKINEYTKYALHLFIHFILAPSIKIFPSQIAEKGQ